MPKIMEFTAGFFIVLLVMFDVFSSVLVPRPAPRGIRVGPALIRVMAPLWRRLAQRLPSARLRQSVRASLGPALLVLALGAWVIALTVGFALMLHSQPQNVRLDHFSLGEALFQASLAISTLGMIHADVLGWGRAVVAIAGIAGFSVLSLVVAFLLSIQSAMHRRESLVLTLDARGGRPATACTLAATMAGATDDTLARFFGAWEGWVSEVAQSHLSYPVLFRFRSLHEDGEWLACLGAVLDFAALVRAVDAERYPEAGRAAGFLALTAARAVHEFARVLHLPRDPPPLDRGDDGPLLAHLVRHGFEPRSGAAFEQRLRSLRAEHATRLPQVAEQLDLAWPDTLGGTRL